MLNRNTWRFASAAVAIVAASCLASPTQAEETISTGDGLLSLTANMPEEVRVGEEFTYRVKVENISDNVTLHDIELEQMKANGFSVESTSVQSKGDDEAKEDQEKSNNGMTIAILKPGESKTIDVTASADEEGELRSCLAIVNYKPSICLTSQVIKPELELTKTAPKQAGRCHMIELEYMVTNDGSGNVGAFVITDTLGSGLATIEGNETLKFEVDGLAAGESRKFAARVYATKPGSFSSRAVAEAENSELKSRSKETTTEVIAADLAVEVEGPNRLYGEQLAKFTAHVTNTGNAPADDVQVSIHWPEASNLVDLSEPRMQSSNQSSQKSNEQSQEEPTVAENAGDANNESTNNGNNENGNGNGNGNGENGENGNDAENDADLAMSDRSMTIGRLEAGQTAVIQYAVRTGDVDTLPTKVVARYICSVDAAEGEASAKSEASATAMARAEVVRFPALQLVVFDSEDPVATESNVVYTIRVWNEGDATDSDVKLKAELPEGLEFESATGPTEHSVEGSTVTFKPIETLQPGDRADYKITAKSVGDGDVRFSATLNSKSLEKEVTAEEPTRLIPQQVE